jgi:ABC-type molybdenum transport system ATPase subunit/photorepair protein PhrA
MQRVVVAHALISQPSILILDEPTADLEATNDDGAAAADDASVSGSATAADAASDAVPLTGSEETQSK